VIALVALNNGPVVMTIIKFYIGSREYEVKYYSAMMMILLGFSLLGQGLVVQFANYLQATKRIMMANIVYILDDIVLVIIGVWLSKTKLTPFSEGDEQLIYSTFLGLAIAQVFMVPLIPVIIAIVNHRLVFGWDALLMLPKGFGVPKDCEFVSSPSSVESAVEFSRDAYDFCISKGVDAKKAYGISLAAEELIKNTIEHGAYNKNKNIIEARIVVKTDEVILSLRDNCNKFNPKKYYNKIYDFTDKTKNIGIRMVMRLATDVSYTTALKLNNITVRMGDPA
jgi:anti-sigma regulatory factor (Ser/Thr protein kinase)